MRGIFREVRTLQNWLLLGPDTMDPLLILGVVLVAGSAGGWAAARIGVPRITGNIFAGVFMAATILERSKLCAYCSLFRLSRSVSLP